MPARIRHETGRTVRIVDHSCAGPTAGELCHGFLIEKPI